MPQLSIVTPVYRTSAYVEEFHARITAAARTLTPDYEILFVNDGSPDDAREKILRLRERDPRVGLVDLSRNFGQHAAIFEGLHAARGNVVFVLDGDLEEHPEWLLDYWRAMQNHKADVVYGYQQSRKGGRLERLTGALSFFIVNKLYRVPNRRNVVTATLMNRSFLSSLLLHTESRAVFSVTCYLTGFASHALVVEKQHRGASGYSFLKRLSHFIDYTVAATTRPLAWPGVIGAIFTLIGTYLTLTSGMNYGKLITALILLVGGIILISLGVLGVYLAQVLENVRRRPNAIIQRFYAPSGE